MKIKNLALTISLVSFAVGFSDLSDSIIFQLGRPVGAIAFIVFFIFVLLEKEYSVFDEQERKKAKQLGTDVPKSSPARQSQATASVPVH